MLEFLLNRDIFGYEIRLNFNRDGSTHRTWIGGVLGLVTAALMTSYVILKILICANY